MIDSSNKKQVLSLIALLCIMVLLVAPVFNFISIESDYLSTADIDSKASGYSAFTANSEIFEEVDGFNFFIIVMYVMIVCAILEIILIVKPICCENCDYTRVFNKLVAVALICIAIYFVSSIILYNELKELFEELFEVLENNDLKIDFCGYVPLVALVILGGCYVYFLNKDKEVATLATANIPNVTAVADNDEKKATTDTYAMLRQYNDMLKEGIITQEEYDKIKAQLLSTNM